MSGALNGVPIVRGHVTIPKAGIWWADLQLSTGDEISTGPGEAIIELQGLTLVGTVFRGSGFNERGFYRIVGGRGRWRRNIPERPYRSAAGVKLSTVLMDAAAEAGELLGTLPTTKVGPSYLRTLGPASGTLETFVPDGWYVDEAGVTQVGSRPVVDFTAAHVILDKRPDLGMFSISAEDLATLLPGARIDGEEIASVRHELTSDKLRSYAWVTQAGVADRLVGALKALMRFFTRETKFHALYEYRVDAFNSGFADLRPARARIGLPTLTSIELRCGVPGGSGEPQVGSSVLLAFIDGEPTRPFVLAYEGEAGNGFIPVNSGLDASSTVAIGASADDVALAAALARVLRSGEKVQITGLIAAGSPVTAIPSGAFISLDPSNIVPGPPGTGFSKVQA